MRRYLYILMEGSLSVIVLILFVVLCIIECNVLIVVLSLIGSVHFIKKIVIGIKLLIDFIEGSHETHTVFMGNMGTEHLDFFYKISFSNIYFDDKVLTKNYFLFDDICNETLRQNDKISIKYYRHSRIVLQVYKCDF